MNVLKQCNEQIDRVEKQCKSDPETNEVIKDIRSNINERYN